MQNDTTQKGKYKAKWQITLRHKFKLTWSDIYWPFFGDTADLEVCAFYVPTF